MSSLLNVKLVVASLEGDVFKKRFLGGFLGLARILWGLEGVCVLLEDDRVNLTVCSVFSAVSQFSIKRNHINDQVYQQFNCKQLVFTRRFSWTVKVIIKIHPSTNSHFSTREIDLVLNSKSDVNSFIVH